MKCVKLVLKHFLKTVYNITDKEKKLWLRNKDKWEILDVGNIYDLIDKETKGKFETKIQQMNKSENIKDMDQN